MDKMKIQIYYPLKLSTTKIPASAQHCQLITTIELNMQKDVNWKDVYLFTSMHRQLILYIQPKQCTILLRQLLILLKFCVT